MFEPRRVRVTKPVIEHQTLPNGHWTFMELATI